MGRFWAIICMLVIYCAAGGQVRNGWRSIYDKEGRLTRMYFYKRGEKIADSTIFFQYYAENVLKALVTGEIFPQDGGINGSVSLFDYSGQMTSYHIKKENYLLFNADCDYDKKCTAVWRNHFEVESDDWKGHHLTFQGGNMIIQNDSSMAYAGYNPVIPVNLNNQFVCKVVIPVKNNNAKQGLALGWGNENYYYLFEISFGKYYAVLYWKNGKYGVIGHGRNAIEKPGITANELVIRNNGKDLIVEINGVIEKVLPYTGFGGDKIVLFTRSKGEARFSDFIFSYQLAPDDPFFENFWIGKGTGFFISPTKILTTYDVVADAKKLRIIGNINGIPFNLPAKVVRLEEGKNLAVLTVDDSSFTGPQILPYGFTDHIPVSGSSAFALGYPNAVSGICLPPDWFEGVVLPSSAISSNNRLLEIPFRYGMTGAPVFDNDANLIGVYATRGMNIKYTSIVDFYDNARLFRATLGRSEKRLASPVKDDSLHDKIKALSQVVVIIESNAFGSK